MALPIQASLTGGSSSAKSDGQQGNYDTSGGAGIHGTVFNIATGGSGLTSTAGGASVPVWVWYAAGAAVAFYAWKKWGK